MPGEIILPVFYFSTLQGWLTGQSSELFGTRLQYYDPSPGIVASWTGNITEWRWSHGATASCYEFTYDGFGRLTGYGQKAAAHNDSADWTLTPASLFTEQLTYDKNGNIKTLARRGNHVDTGANVTDHLTYGHTGNRLTSLDHTNASGSVESSGTKSYSYDVNGNMTYDQRKGLHFNYNYLNLLQNVSQTGGTDRAGYAWLADGKKVQVTDNTDKGYVYLGSLVYSKAGSAITFESTGFGSGRLIATSGSSGVEYIPQYHITDHLGSVRVVFNYAANGSINRIAQNDFYAFGKKHVNPILRNASEEVNRWLYNGKEQQVIGDLGLMDFNTRMYNDELAIFHKMDLLLDNFPWQSPYVYAINSPVRYMDFMGMNPKTATEEDPINPEEQQTPLTIEELIAAGYVVIFQYQAPPEKRDNFVEDPARIDYGMGEELNYLFGGLSLGFSGISAGLEFSRPFVSLVADGSGGYKFFGLNTTKIGKGIASAAFVFFVAVDAIGVYNYYTNPEDAKFKVSPKEFGFNTGISGLMWWQPWLLPLGVIHYTYPGGVQQLIEDGQEAEAKILNSVDTETSNAYRSIKSMYNMRRF